jgi:HB1, ASXL, restriction endonuclease HTH domain
MTASTEFASQSQPQKSRILVGLDIEQQQRPTGGRPMPATGFAGSLPWGGTTTMSTLAVVEEILRETNIPMSVREIVEHAGSRLPSKSKTPDTVVARDLSMDLKKKGESSIFIRTSPGRYTLRELASRQQPTVTTSTEVATPVLAAAMRSDRAAPLAARKPVSTGLAEQTATSRQGP